MKSDTFLCLSEELCSLILSFVVGSLSSLPNIAAVDHKLHRASLSPGAWKDALIVVPPQVFTYEKGAEQLVKMGTACWVLAREVRLPAHPAREMMHLSLSKALPELPLSIIGEGPFMFFAIPSHLTIGDTIGLHFFEPRYRWMCQRMFSGSESPNFGFVTSSMCRPGSHGVICEVLRHHANPNGTYDTNVKATAEFSVLEMWFEEVPDNPTAPKLAVGFVSFSSAPGVGFFEEGQPTTTPLRQLHSSLTNQDSPLVSVRRILSRFAGCCKRRRR